MNTKIIMTASSIVLASAGIALTFIPNEISKYFNLEQSGSLLLLLQILGALYFAFAMLNWMSRNSVIGGIYNKPIVVANFAHFFIGAMALIKGLLSNSALPLLLWIIAIVYSLFALIYGRLFYTNPGGKKQ